MRIKIQLAAFGRDDRFIWGIDLPNMTVEDAAAILSLEPAAFIGEFDLSREQVERVLDFAPGLRLDDSTELQFEIGTTAVGPRASPQAAT